MRGSNPGGGEIFRTCPDRPWGPPSLLYNGYQVFPGVKSGRGLTLTPHPLLVPWSRKSGAITLLPQWAVRPVQSLSACTRMHFTLYHYVALISVHEESGIKRISVKVQYHLRYVHQCLWPCSEPYSRPPFHGSALDTVQTYRYFANISVRPGTLKTRPFMFLHWIYEVITKKLNSHQSGHTQSSFIRVYVQSAMRQFMEFISSFSQLPVTTVFRMRSRDGSRCKNSLSHLLPC